ncbi:MAG: hypothetical protein GX346_00695 [Clostridiales bacterium]|nr:hypothetical protein [Clostridiales bacterium]
MYNLLKEAIGKDVSIDTDDNIYEGRLVAVEGSLAKVISDESTKKLERSTAYYINLRYVNNIEVVEYEKDINY